MAYFGGWFGLAWIEIWVLAGLGWLELMFKVGFHNPTHYGLIDLISFRSMIHLVLVW